MLVVVPTTEVAERTFADLIVLSWAKRKPVTVALVRRATKRCGALDSPSERSARMTLLADLCAPPSANRHRTGGRVAAKSVMPCDVFEPRRLTLAARRRTRAGTRWGERLYRLGYARVDVVSAAGEYAVRGGLLDVFPATAEQPRCGWSSSVTRSNRSARSTSPITTQRGRSRWSALTIVPWLEIPRDERSVAGTCIARATGEPTVVSAVRAYLTEGTNHPGTLAGLAYDSAGDVVDYLDGGRWW